MSSRALQFIRGQEGHVEQYRVELLDFGTTSFMNVVSDGWDQTVGIPLVPGELYRFKLTPISNGKSGESVSMSDSTYPAPPVVGSRTFTKNSIQFDLSYEGTVEVKVTIKLANNFEVNELILETSRKTRCVRKR